MFIGHYAVGFASKRLAPRASLGALIAAVSLLDLIFPILVLAGVEIVRIDPGHTVVTPLDLAFYPYSHSLLFAVLWAALFAGFYYWRTRYRAGALVIAGGVLSHWVLDVVSHAPDVPLFPGSDRVGLGLWNSLVGTVVVESGLFAIGVWLYVSGTQATNGAGRWALWAMVALLAVAYAGNMAGPPPPSVRAMAVTGLAAWLFPVWAWWIDRNRQVRE